MGTESSRHYKRAPSPALLEEGLLARLTTRQKEVLSLLAAGKSNKEIAASLYVTPSTVKAHVARLFHALEVNSRTEAAVLWTEAVMKTGLDDSHDGERRKL